MKYALVTGGSRGIGRAVCVKLASMGYNVVINYVSNEAEALKTKEMVEAYGVEGEILKFDVSNREETVSAIENWQENHKGEYIEVLVNNAGIRKDNLMMWMEPEDWSSVVNISLDCLFNVTRPLLQPMLVKKFGRIVNMVSLSGLKGIPEQVNYSASKAGVIGATKALAQEVARKNVTVNAVAPGYIKTDMVDGLNEAELKKQIPANRFGDLEDVANLVGFLVSTDSSYITGEVININGGLYS